MNRIFGLNMPIPDELAAILARGAMPLTQEQIEWIGALLQQTRGATARGAGAPPIGRSVRYRVNPGDGQGIPVISLAKGYTTAVSFVDKTGEAWPIEEVLVDSQFLPAGGGSAGAGANHLVYFVPARGNLHGNAIVKLAGLVDPLALTLVDDGVHADFMVDIRIDRPGPNANAAVLVQLPEFNAGDGVLLDLLAGIAPAGAIRLVVEGGGYGSRAWRQGTDLLVVMNAEMLSPGPWAAERSSDGRWAYRIQDVPFALVSIEGRETRISFREDILSSAGDLQ